MYIAYLILLFILGLCLGYLAHAWWVSKHSKYSGTMYVRRDELREKTVYTLELDDYPEELRFKKTVIFKVKSPEDRE